eukprot:6689730-Alexandrium_andersonii.AAC.1
MVIVAALCGWIGSGCRFSRGEEEVPPMRAYRPLLAAEKHYLRCASWAGATEIDVEWAWPAWLPVPCPCLAEAVRERTF